MEDAEFLKPSYSPSEFLNLSTADLITDEEPAQASIANGVPDGYNSNRSPNKRQKQEDGDNSNQDLGQTSTNRDFLELQEANNISKAAYKEIMVMAFELKSWVVTRPALGSLEGFLQMFTSLPSLGMKAEHSIERAILPINPDQLVSIMVDVDSWSSSFPYIVHKATQHAPAGILRQLTSADEGIKKLTIVNTEFCLPTPLVETRRFCFLRCLREIIPGVWAIIDVSNDYFPQKAGFRSEPCQRRPSGLIVNSRNYWSEVIWIENVEIPESLSEQGIYSGMIINSDWEFSAKRWVSSLIWRLKRDKSTFSVCEIAVNKKAGTHLLCLTDAMRRIYLELISKTPDKKVAVALSDKDVRINEVADFTTMGLVTYIAATTFRLQAEPIMVFRFLTEKNIDLQWRNSHPLEEPEELIRFASDDNSNCITLHGKEASMHYPACDYLLQENSRDGYCFFVISTPIDQLDVKIALVHGTSAEDATLHPSGFAIMPDGPDGLNSESSLVTLAVRLEFDFSETDDEVIEKMYNLVDVIVEEITEEINASSNT